MWTVAEPVWLSICAAIAIAAFTGMAKPSPLPELKR